MNGMTEFHRPLFDLQPITAPSYPREATIQERFEAFHARNPHVFDALKRLALEMRLRGMPRWSIKAAYEVLRWLYALQTQGERYRLSNDFHALYARKLMQDVPELAGFFETRSLRS